MPAYRGTESSRCYRTLGQLGTGWEKRKLAQHRRKIVELYDSIDQSYRSAYNAFAQALLVHDEWEKYYIENLDPSKANALNEQLVGTLFADRDLRKAADMAPISWCSDTEWRGRLYPEFDPGYRETVFPQGPPGFR